MKKSSLMEGQSASELIDKRIAELEGWRGDLLMQQPNPPLQRDATPIKNSGSRKRACTKKS